MSSSFMQKYPPIYARCINRVLTFPGEPYIFILQFPRPEKS